MMGFIGRGEGYVVVVTAPNKVEATRLIIELFRASGLELVEMDILEFDPTQAGGLIVENPRPEGRHELELGG
jgi:hypothetical protein